jgi:hypothetical protein
MLAELAATWRRTPIALVALVLALATFGAVIAPQIVSLPMPISGAEGHHWRQAFTYGVAWNFAHTTWDVLHPRMFVELARSNVIPMEAPLYPFLASLPMRVFADSVVAPRALSLFGLVGFFYALRNGFAVGDRVSAESLASMRARGARVLVHYGEEGPPPIVGALLEAGTFWRVFCVAEAGC